MSGRCAVVLSILLSTLAVPLRAEIQPVAPKCEYRVDPLGIDVQHPRLAWRLDSKERNQRQSAYRILVASSIENLKRDNGDLWDSGKVESSESSQIEYGGRALKSCQACWWKVQTWDGDGTASAWTKPAGWTMGLLRKSDWHAQWIGGDAKTGAENPTYLPALCLRKTFAVTRPLRRALVYVTAAGLYELYIDGKRVSNDCLRPGWTEFAKRVYYQTYDVTSLIKGGGKHVVAAMLGDGWYGLHHGGRGRTALLAQMRLEYKDDYVGWVDTDGTWRTTASGPIRDNDIYNGETYDARREMPGWATASFDDSAWKPARVGFLESGSKFDVTEIVRQAIKDNALEIGANNETFGEPALGLVKTLTVDYRQGVRTRKATVKEGDVLRINARGTLTIIKAVYGPSAEVGSVAKAVLQAHPGSPVGRTGEIKPVKITEPQPGAYVFDMGQNFAGWARLKIRAESGRKIQLRFAEMLNPDGTIYTTNLRSAKCTDTYYCKGSGTEIWEPRFTFHGYRYVELTGAETPPDKDTITGIVLNSDGGLTSDFVCSNELLNRLFKNIVWGQRSNYLEVPTDCPQRDERMGWSGDAQVFIGTGAYNMDIAPFFTAWLNTFNDSQDVNGGYPNVSPNGGGVSPAWGDAGIICPWTLWRVYGDTRVIKDHWTGMTRWIEYLKQRSNDLVRPSEGFGDWLNLGADMPRDVISTAYFAHVTKMMAQMAEATGKTADAAKYSALFTDIKAAFNKAFVSEDGRIKGDTQTTYLMSLGFDLLPADKRQLATARLVELFAERKNHISTGFLGVNLLLPVLTQIGKPDLAWTLLTNKDYPSWLYSVTQGATTIWERWDGWTDTKGFQDPGMNSFNHYSYGACGQWMFSSAAGIDTAGIGFHHLIIHPIPGGGLSFVRAHYDSIHGRIATEWHLDGKTFSLVATIPANVEAEVYIPATSADQVTESGQPVSSLKGIKYLRSEDGCAVFEVGSGTYKFKSK